MIYKPSILNIAAGAYIISCIIYTIVNYEGLAANEGWGVIYMLALLGFGFLFLVIDFLLQLFIKDRQIVNMIGLFITIAGIILYVTA